MTGATPKDRWAGPVRTGEDFERFYVEYRLRALAWIHRKQPSWDDATCQDVAADAWAALYANVGRIERARAYLFRTLNAKITDEGRRRRAGPRPEHPPTERADPWADPERLAMLPAVLAQIRAELHEVLVAVHDLPETLQDAYLLRVGSQPLTSAEIAEVLECSPAAVDVRVARARAQLRGRFSAERLAHFEKIARRTG